MAEYSEEYLQAINTEWEAISGQKLTLADAREIADNTINLFTLLQKLHIKYVQNGIAKGKKPDENQ
jgi:hypothetical protein